MDINFPDLETLPTSRLLRLSRLTLAELLRRGVIRTLNAPAGDLAEYVVAKAYQGELAPNSEKSWDVRASDGRKLQVKCKVRSPRRTTLLSPFRSFDFDAAVIVILSEDDLSVVKAVEIPVGLIKEHSSYSAHLNGWRTRSRIADLVHPDVRDMTDPVAAAMGVLG